MAKKKKNSTPAFSERFSFMHELEEETVQVVVALLLLALSAVLTLAAFDMAGSLGTHIFRGLTYLFGVGYYLLPLVLFSLAISYFASLRQDVGVLRILAAVLFFIAGLGLIEIFADTYGGLFGNLIASPLVSLFDLYASVLILSVLALIALIVILETHLKIAPATIWDRLTAKRERDEEEGVAVSYAEEEPAEEEEEVEETEEEEEEPEEAPKKKKGVLGGMFGSSEESEEQLITPDKVFAEYQAPPLSLLERDKGKPGTGDIKANANIIKRTLQNFGITVEMDEVSVGPSVTRYALKPAEGVRISKIVSLQSNLELALAASPVRIEAPIPGKSLVGIEVPNTAKTTLGLSTLFSNEGFAKSLKPLLTVLGRDITGAPHYADIGKMPHALVAGATGSGKSVMIHSIVSSLLYRNGPESMRLIMVDPKRVELTLYNSIPHLLTPVITDAKKAILALKWAAKEMDRRYDVLEAEQVRDISSYHTNVFAPAQKEYERKKKKGITSEDESALPEPMPHIVVIVDELADIMQAYPRELEAAIVRLAQMSRAVGIHLLLSTQRPSVNVITGLIKANIPTRIALQVSSQIDSRTILDQSGAEKLLGAGDMLYLSGDMAKPVRIQSPFISENEVKKMVQYIASHNDYAPEAGLDLTGGEVSGAAFSASIGNDDGDDDLYEEARRVVSEAGKASTSYLQRKLRVGYARAARLMDLLEERGVIGPADGSKPRDVLEQDEAEETEESSEYEADEVYEPDEEERR